MKHYAKHVIMSAKDDDGVGTSFSAKDFMHLVFALDATIAVGASATLKCQGSIADSTPDFSAAQSESNQWSYVQIIDLESGDPIDGNTGISLNASQHEMFEINDNGLNFINFIVSGVSGGVSITVAVQSYNNN